MERSLADVSRFVRWVDGVALNYMALEETSVWGPEDHGRYTQARGESAMENEPWSGFVHTVKKGTELYT